MKRILPYLFIFAIACSALAQQSKVLSIFKDGVVMYRIPVSDMDSMNFNDSGSLLSYNEVGESTASIMNLLVQYDLASTSHDSFGYMAILHATDMMSEDIVSSKLSHFRFDYVHDNIRFNYRRTNMIWKYFTTVISQANRVIASVPASSTNPVFRNSLGHAFAMRAFSNFYLLQLYQFTGYYSNPANLQLPAIPLLYATNEPLYSKRNYRVPASEVLAQCEADYQKSLELLTENRNSKNELNRSVVNGFLARLYLLRGDWNKALESARAARQNFPLMDSNQLNDGFISIDNPEWMWGYRHSTATSTLYASFFSHISNLSPGYAGLQYAPRLIDKRLYDQLAVTANDRRLNWFQDASGSRVATQPASPEATAWKIPYANLKFGFETDFAQDYVYMRSAEMYLIEAEALLRVGRETEARDVMNQLLYSRISGTAQQTLNLEQVLLQRRIELWGEGFAYFDLKRLNRGVDRAYTGTNHETTARIAVPAGDIRWNFEIPEQAYVDVPGMINETMMPGFIPQAPVVLSGTAASYTCTLTSHRTDISALVGVQLATNEAFTENVRNITTSRLSQSTFADTVRNLLPETAYFIRYTYSSSFGKVFSKTYPFTTLKLMVPSNVHLIVDSIGTFDVKLSASYQFAQGTQTTVLSKGFEVSKDTLFQQQLIRKLISGDFTGYVGNLLHSNRYLIRAFVTTIDGVKYSPVAEITTLADGGGGVVSPLNGIYTEVDYLSTGATEGPYSSAVTITTTNQAGTMIGIHNFWDGGNFTINAEVDYDKKTFKIAPQQIYQDLNYGVCRIYPYNASTNTIDKSGTPVTGVIEADGSLTVGSWAAVVDAGNFGRYLKSTLHRTGPASAPPVNSNKVTAIQKDKLLQESQGR